MIGETLDGHDLDLLQLGTPGKGKRNVWVIHRQHPGVCFVEKIFLEKFSLHFYRCYLHPLQICQVIVSLWCHPVSGVLSRKAVTHGEVPMRSNLPSKMYTVATGQSCECRWPVYAANRCDTSTKQNLNCHNREHAFVTVTQVALPTLHADDVPRVQQAVFASSVSLVPSIYKYQFYRNKI